MGHFGFFKKVPKENQHNGNGAQQLPSFLASLVASTADAIIGKDLDGMILSWNSGAEKMYGFTESEIKGKSILTLYPEERKSEFDEIMEKIKKGQRVENFETVRQRKNGSEISVSLTISPIFSSQGIIGASTIARDITEHRAVFQRQAVQYAVALVLTQSRGLPELFSKLIQIICSTLGWDMGAIWLINRSSHALDCVKTWSIETSGRLDHYKVQIRREHFTKGSGLPGKVWNADQPLWIVDLKSNRELLNSFGESAEEFHSAFGFPIRILGDTAGVVCFYSRKAKPVDEKLIQMFNTIGHQIGQFMEHRELEKQRMEQTIALEHKNEELAKRERIMRSLLDDIHASNKNLEHQQKFLQQINSRLAQLSLLKDEFVATVSHELRTPLTSIKEGLSLVLDGALGPINAEQEDFLRTVDQSADRLTELINNLLDIAKVEAGRLRLARRRVSLNNLIRTAVQNYKIIAGKRTVEIEEKTVPDVFVDPDRMLQVFGNLFSNAVKFTAEDGTIRFKTSSNENTVSVSVEDNGCGIAKEDLPKLFEKFSQVGSSGHRSGGTGLGLALCRELIDMHQGKIWAESNLSQGTTFMFTIPIYTLQIDLEDHFNKAIDRNKAHGETALIVLDIETCCRTFSLDSSNFIDQWVEMIRRVISASDSLMQIEGQRIIIFSPLGSTGIEPILTTLKNCIGEWTAHLGLGTALNYILIGWAIYPADAQNAQALYERAVTSLGPLASVKYNGATK